MMWALLLLAAVIAIPLVVEVMRKPMNDKARKQAPGQFARLSQGLTHYQWHGPEDGPVAVCIHGLTTPSFVWRGVAAGLAGMGFRVLTYDLFGRGYSDRPRGMQDRHFFLRQLNDLLDDQQVDDDLTVVGYSMGGAIATAFAADQPHGIRSLILIASAGTGRPGSSLTERLVMLPVIGTWLMLLRYPSILRNGLKLEKSVPGSIPGITHLQEAELDYRGFVPAVHQSLRGILSETLQEDHKTLGREGVPVLAIWGADDDVIPTSAADIIVTWNEDTQSHIVKGAGHGVTYTHTETVLALIGDFSRQSD